MHFYVSHRSRLTAARCFESSHRSALRLRGVPRLRSASRCPRRFSPSGLRLCTALRSVCSALQPFGPSPFRKRLHPQFAIVDPHRTQSVLVALVAHWAYFGLFHSTIHNGLTACNASVFIGVFVPACASLARYSRAADALWRVLAPPPLRGFDGPVSRTARGEAPSHWRRPPCAPQKMPEMTYTPQFAMVVLLRPRAYSTPLFIGVFVPACASLARYSRAADALWACPRPSTPSGLRRACFAHCARPPCAPSFLI